MCDLAARLEGFRVWEQPEVEAVADAYFDVLDPSAALRRLTYLWRTECPIGTGLSLTCTKEQHCHQVKMLTNERSGTIQILTNASIPPH